MGKKKDDKRAAELDFIRAVNSKFYGPGAKIRDQLERYGVEGVVSVKQSARSLPEHFRTTDDVKRDLSNAMMNDYDTRRSMEAAALLGNKDAKKYAKKGFDTSASSLIGGYDVLKDLKKEYVGGGGMNGPENRASLTHALVTNDREQQTAAYDEKYAKTTDLNALKDKLMAEASEKAAVVQKDIEPSDRLASVQDRFEKAASNRPPSMFDKENSDPAKADDQADAARTFLTDYKDDVISGARLKEDIETNLANAAHTVTNVYGR